MIAAYEAPAEKVRGEIFNVLHSNYQIRELAMIVAGSVQLTGREVALEEAPAPKLTRDYECSNAKLSTTLGFIPRRSVLEAVTDHARAASTATDRPTLTDPRYYNIRWLELLYEVKPALDSLPGGPVRRADHRRRRPARPPTSQALLGDRRGAVRSPRRARHHRRRRRSTRVFDEVAPDVVFNCAAFHNVDVCETEPDRAWRGQRRAPCASLAAARRRGSSTSRPTTSSTGGASEPYGEDDLPAPRVDLRAHQARRRVRRAGLRRRARWSCAPPASTACTAAPPRAATSCSGCSRGRASRAR